MTYRKKLIEVALPLEAINVASAREKSIRHGHPSTLHLWWARRPLAACRAVLFASLVDDPDSDPAYARYDAETRDHMAGEKRQQLFDLITELVQWESSNNELIINAARAEIARCVASRKIELGELSKDHKLSGGETAYDLVVKGHGDLPKPRAGTARLPNAESVNAFLAEHAPPVLDPFCGGGSIPLEAQRLGLRAYASDLNPVPVLINKALIEIPPKFANMPPVNPESRGEAGPAGTKGRGRGKSVIGESRWRGAQGLAEDVRYYGKWMRDEAKKRIGHLYPRVKVTSDMATDRHDLKPCVGEELTVIAWLWARTVASPDPAVGGAHVPLLRSFWLSTKKQREAWPEPIVDGRTNTFQFRVRRGNPSVKETIEAGTKSGRAMFACLFTGTPISGSYVDAEANAGRMRSIPLAVVADSPGGRIYLPITVGDAARLSDAAEDMLDFDDLPSQPARATFAGNAQGRAYGFKVFSDYFTTRQLLLLQTLVRLIGPVRENIIRDCSAPHTIETSRNLPPDAQATRLYADAIATYLSLGLGVSKLVDYNSALVS